jgi:hypothetical protein
MLIKLFKEKNIKLYNNKYKTFIIREMLKKSFLKSNLVYTFFVYKEKNLKKYFKKLDIINY